MLIGEYTHTVDEKRRVSLPAKFRKSLGKTVVVTHGLDGSLFIYALPEWQRIMEKLSELSIGQSDSRAFNRFMLAGAQDVSVDSLGRILIPDYLASYAKIEDSAVLIGVSDRVEVWNPATWQAYKAQTISQADRMAEKLGDLGAL